MLMKKILLFFLIMFSCISCTVSHYELTYVMHNDTTTIDLAMKEREHMQGHDSYAYVRYVNGYGKDMYTLNVRDYYRDYTIIFTTEPIQILNFKYIKDK